MSRATTQQHSWKTMPSIMIDRGVVTRRGQHASSSASFALVAPSRSAARSPSASHLWRGPRARLRWVRRRGRDAVSPPRPACAQRRPGTEQVPVTEHSVGVEVHLAALGLGGPGPATPPRFAHRGRPSPGPIHCCVALRSGSWRPLGPTLSVSSSAMIWVDDGQPGIAAEGHEAVFDGAGQVAQGDGRLRRQRQRGEPPRPAPRRSQQVASSSLVVVPSCRWWSWFGRLKRHKIRKLEAVTNAAAR